MTDTIQPRHESRGGFLDKISTSSPGLDEVLGGGYPKGRVTVLCGNTGCGKTLLAMQFLAQGCRENENGLFVSFDESPSKLVDNFSSLDWNVRERVESGEIQLEHIDLIGSELQVSGNFDLNALFVRIDSAIQKCGARRIILDSIDNLFLSLKNEAVLRNELMRLFRWFEQRELTVVTTSAAGDRTLTNTRIEEYVSDCVIRLSNTLEGDTAVRRLFVVKYRGTEHGSNDYPFLITNRGVTLFPITSLLLNHEVYHDRVSSGIAGLDKMLGGGYFMGSSVLVSGTAGTGKTTVAACFAATACNNGQRVAYVAMEESPTQIIRNVGSVGIDLQPHVSSGQLKFHAVRPTFYGLERHLVAIMSFMENHDPKFAVIDPISNLAGADQSKDIRSFLVRLIDYLKSRGTTVLFTNLTIAGAALESTESEISSLMDTWLLMTTAQFNERRKRRLLVIKSRGMGHDVNTADLSMSNDGIEVQPQT